MQQSVRRRRVSVGIFLAIVMSGGLLPITAALAAPLVVNDISDNSPTAAALAQSLVGDGVAISNVTFTGAPAAGGTFSGGADVVGFAQGVILSSGLAEESAGVPSETADSASDRPGDADLDALVDGSTMDAAVLEFDFVPEGDALTFSYVFGSEEYDTFVGGSFNDVFGFFVNDSNCATVGDPPQPVSINTINNGENADLYIDNDASSSPRQTRMNGLTTVLTCTAQVSPGVSNRMKLAIADRSDSALDSVVFIQAGSLTSEPIEGGITRVEVTPDLQCLVEHDGVAQFFSDDSCGTFVAVDSGESFTLYGPAGEEAGWPDAVPFTAGSQTLTGNGTPADPSRIETTVTLGDTALELTQVDEYVLGSETLTTTLTLGGEGGERATIYRAVDCHLEDDDEGFGEISGTTAVACISALNPDTAEAEPGAGRLGWTTQSPDSSVKEGQFQEVFAALTGAPLDGTCACDEYVDNGMAMAWQVEVPQPPSEGAQLAAVSSAPAVAQTLQVAPRLPEPTPTPSPSPSTSPPPSSGGGGGGGGGPVPTPTPTVSPTVVPTEEPTVTPTELVEDPDEIAVPPGGFDGDVENAARLDQDEEQFLANQVSQTRFDDAEIPGAGKAADRRLAQHVVLVRDDLFADSLAGTPLSADGPLLFSGRTTIRPETLAEMDRVLVDGGKIYMLGGQAAIGPEIEEHLRTRGFDVERIAGPTRVETALGVADKLELLYGAPSRATLARAYSPEDNPTASWADSITGGAWAASQRLPVLITPTEELHPSVAQWMADHEIGETVMFGGKAALSDEVEATVPGARRIGGATRAETASAIATELWDFEQGEQRRYVVINGFREDGWKFGLTAGGLSSDAGAPQLLVDDGSIPEATRALVSECGQSKVEMLIMGTTDVVSAQQRLDLDALDGNAC